ncbi:hypothetical protein [Paenibacillus sp. HJGM_3]|uniref:hypothetical protein n=1 Tax=Paenibacillus sp. HJGM_3 TaxID=3379816 RepID=UPI00385CB741
MMYAGAYLLIGLIFAHFAIAKVDRQISEEVESGEVSEEANDIIEKSDRIQNVIGYKNYLAVLYIALSIFWLPAVAFKVLKHIGGKRL